MWLMDPEPRLFGFRHSLFPDCSMPAPRGKKKDLLLHDSLADLCWHEAGSKEKDFLLQ